MSADKIVVAVFRIPEGTAPIYVDYLARGDMAEAALFTAVSTLDAEEIAHEEVERAMRTLNVWGIDPISADFPDKGVSHLLIPSSALDTVPGDG